MSLWPIAVRTDASIMNLKPSSRTSFRTPEGSKRGFLSLHRQLLGSHMQLLQAEVLQSSAHPLGREPAGPAVQCFKTRVTVVLATAVLCFGNQKVGDSRAGEHEQRKSSRDAQYQTWPLESGPTYISKT